MAWFDSHAQDYDQWYQSKLGKFVDAVEKKLIEEIAKPAQGEKVLDIGSGTGLYSLWLAEKGLNVSAIDQSEEMLKIAKKKAEEAEIAIDWNLGDAASLPFAEKTFDLVISITAVEFMDKPQAVLQEAMRVLKPSGRLVIGLLTKESPWGELYRKAAEENPNSVFSIAHLYKESEISDLLKSPYLLRKGLYLPPTQEFDLDEAWKLEEEKQAAQADSAGFFAVRWNKEND